jgi:mono/diheme cytochrome c family protein
MRIILAFSALTLVATCGQSPDNPQVATGTDAPAVEMTEPSERAPLFDAAALGVPTDAESIADGRNIAQALCSNCHALDQDASLRTDAPPLRHILSRYHPDSLADDFTSGIHVGHQDMPDFVFGPLGMDVLLAYLVSIQEQPPQE